jgi:hypothetical protein
MGKIIRLTESQLTSIVRRVISENMKSEMIDDVKNEIVQSISKEDLMFLGKMYSELGPEEFKDITQDVIENEDSQSELSEISFKVKDSSDIDRINRLKEIIGQITIIALPVTAAAGIGQMNREVPDESGALFFGIIGAALVGLNLLRKVPIKGKTVPDNMKGSRIQKAIESQLDDMDLSNKSFEDVVADFELIGIPNHVSIPLISDWAEKNGVHFKNIKKKYKSRFGNG